MNELTRVADRRITLWGLVAAVAVLGTLATGGSTAEAAQDSASGPQAQFTDGAEVCLRCHAAESMTLMAETAHGNGENPHAPYALQGCESCHGPGSLHVSRARGGAGFPALIRFGAEGAPAQIQTKACLGCHAEDQGELEGIAWAGSLHDRDVLTCSRCHRLHALESPLADPALQRANCASCHAKEISRHNNFEDKGIVFDSLSCYDCHDVHQLARAR